LNESHREILLSAESLELGETIRLHCVTCQGSRPTLTVTKKENGTIVWNCYKVTCDERGAKPPRGQVQVSTNSTPRKSRVRPYKGALVDLDDEHLAFLRDKLGFEEQHVSNAGLKWAPEDERYAFAIYGPNHMRRGWMLRSWDSFVRTKALTMLEEDGPHLSWYQSKEPGGTCLVVEDIPSAVRAGAHVSSVSLLGTGCGLEYALEIADNASHVVWALDADAVDQSIKLYNRYKGLMESSEVMILERDLKDESEENLAKLLEKWT